MRTAHTCAFIHSKLPAEYVATGTAHDRWIFLEDSGYLT